MIEVRNISKSYGTTPVVSDVSFSVAQGEVLVLLGTSGSGKTTILKLINRLIEKDEGQIFIESKDTDRLTPFQLRRRIGYVIQSIGLFPHYNIRQNIEVVPQLLGWDRNKISKRTDSLLQMMNLPASIRVRRPHELSGGQQQRVGIARALAADPAVILMDEPFGALDPITRQELQKEFKELEGALDKAIILVTHDTTEAVILADRICLLDKGRVQQLGTPKELIFRPANEFVKEFFDQHRLQAELHVVTLMDLAPFVSNAPDRNGINADPETTIMDCLRESEEAVINFETGGKAWQVRQRDLLKIYFNHREELIGRFHGTD